MAEIRMYQSGISNGFFIVDEHVAIAVDTGSVIGKDAALSCITEAGLKAQDIRLIIITHGHGDHFGNAQALSELTGAPVMCHREAAPFLLEGIPSIEDLEARTDKGKEVLKGETDPTQGVYMSVKGPADIIIGDEGCDLHDWGIEGRCVYTPGHSRGCISVVVGEDAVVGDLFGAPAFSDDSGMPFFQYKGAPFEEAQQSVQKLLDMGVKTFWTGHGSPRDSQYVSEALDKERRLAKKD